MTVALFYRRVFCSVRPTLSVAFCTHLSMLLCTDGVRFHMEEMTPFMPLVCLWLFFAGSRLLCSTWTRKGTATDNSSFFFLLLTLSGTRSPLPLPLGGYPSSQSRLQHELCTLWPQLWPQQKLQKRENQMARFDRRQFYVYPTAFNRLANIKIQDLQRRCRI